MKEQKVIISDEDFKIQRYIQEGWLIVSVTAQHVSAGAGYAQYGKFCFVLERTITY
jgi:hypothetical protein